MTQIVNDDKLNLVLTEYGLNRIAEAVKDPTLNLMISKIKLGSGDNEEYYEPSPSQTTLKGDLGLEFYIYDKKLLEDKVTISFHTIIPETAGDFDIREVGLYETIDGEDILFAISTQQPFVKPSSDYFYFININYYIFLKNVNFSEIYDQIILDPEHSLATEDDLEEMMRTFLFAQGNLIDQIGNNSKIIGYNRATQLYEKITQNQKSFSYITLFKDFTSVVDNTSSINKIFSYWAFDYSDRTDLQNSVMDLSNNGYYLSTNKALTEYEKDYCGFMSTIAFTPSDSFSLSSQIPLGLYDKESQKDIPFTMVFALEPLQKNVRRTLIAKSNYATATHSFEVSELEDRSLQVRLFSSPEDYLTFTSLPLAIPLGSHSIVLSYDPDNQKIIAYINSIRHELLKVETGTYTHINETAGVLYGFGCYPEYSVYVDNASNPTQMYNNDGSPYTGSDWTIEDDTVKYKGLDGVYNESKNIITDKLYAWTPVGTSVFEHVIYTKSETITADTVLYKENYEKEDLSTSLFSIAQSGSSYVILYDGTQTERQPSLDVEPKTIFCYEYVMDRQIIFTNNSQTPSVLYNSDGTYYAGDSWTIKGDSVYYLDFKAKYDSALDKDTFTPDLTSYITDNNGNAVDSINSKVGIVSIIKEKFPNEALKSTALLLCATMGRNPYLGG